MEDGGSPLGTDEEYEVVEVEEGAESGREGGDGEDDEVVQSGTVLSAPAEALARRQQAAELGDETTEFHGAVLASEASSMSTMRTGNAGSASRGFRVR